MLRILCCGFVLAFASSPAFSACVAAGSAGEDAPRARAVDVRDLCVRYVADNRALSRYHDVECALARDARFRRFYDDMLAELERVPFQELDVEGRVDWVLLRNLVDVSKKKLDVRRAQFDEIAAFVPFAEPIAELHEARRRLEAVDPEKTATRLEEIKKLVEAGRKEAEAKKDCTPKPHGVRASRVVDDLKQGVGDWYRFRAAYDPEFTWWVKKPFEALDKALADQSTYLRETLGGVRAGDDKTIHGDPIGADALQVELDGALIAYTPDELIEIADRELAWCRARMLEASREMGLGDDWKKALEKVKEDHVAPGKQPELVRDLARQAVDFLRQKDLVSVPPLLEETWRMEMLSPEAQRESPFFLGGDMVQVAFPTDSMTHEEKRMSMRGNNVHFAHATVFHELIPGHGLQHYYESRFNTHRDPFSTPFWTEGWALYWEMLMWDQGFSTTPEDRIGALFWRSHRCARIKFSLAFHLGQMTPEQCIDFLVDEIGHERENAAAEVRRSFSGGYGPLYQLAYMIGGLQIRALHAELVDSGKMSNRAFHDTILEGNNMPIELVRARLKGEKLSKDFRATWRFYALN
jgi:hypothetical protein